MSDIQEKKDAVLKKLTKAQQKKLSLQEQIVNRTGFVGDFYI